ncbi:hypothetical protein KSF78_0009544 [Schistosoma japonicum]|nr:hypothetical protein KSF78_0009544 [Schistosoma japonicum]
MALNDIQVTVQVDDILGYELDDVLTDDLVLLTDTPLEAISIVDIMIRCLVFDVHGGCGDVLNDEFVNVAYFGFVNVVICAVDENDFVVFEDDGNEVVIVDRYDVDDNDDEMLGENMMNAIGEVMVDGVDVMRGEYCDAGYFGCVDVIDCSVVDVGVMVCVDCEYEEVDGDVIDENRVDVAEAVEVDSNDLVVSELLSTNDMHDFDVVSFL